MTQTLSDVLLNNQFTPSTFFESYEANSKIPNEMKDRLFYNIFEGKKVVTIKGLNLQVTESDTFLKDTPSLELSINCITSVNKAESTRCQFQLQNATASKQIIGINYDLSQGGSQQRTGSFINGAEKVFSFFSSALSKSIAPQKVLSTTDYKNDIKSFVDDSTFKEKSWTMKSKTIDSLNPFYHLDCSKDPTIELCKPENLAEIVQCDSNICNVHYVITKCYEDVKNITKLLCSVNDFSVLNFSVGGTKEAPFISIRPANSHFAKHIEDEIFKHAKMKGKSYSLHKDPIQSNIRINQGGSLTDRMTSVGFMALGLGGLYVSYQQITNAFDEENTSSEKYKSLAVGGVIGIASAAAFAYSAMNLS